jgi:signal peptidase I
VLCPDPSDEGEVVIGRIAAESGDHLTVSAAGDLAVNNARFRSEHACEVPLVAVANPRTGDEVRLHCDVELLGGVRHPRAVVPPNLRGPIPVNTDVPDGHLYLVSDNRFYPFDSRDFGSVPRESCSETIVFRLVSRLGFGHVATRLSVIH